MALSAAEREFLRALSDVVFGNPFTPERMALIRRLAPEAPGDLTSDREALARVVAPKVAPFLRDLPQLGAAERQLVEPALLYVAYHRYVPQLDAHIEHALGGESEAMQRFRQALWNNMFTHDMRGYEAALWNRMEDFSTLLLGETGTGKGSAAAAVGRSIFIPYLAHERRFAANFAESFIAINLSQFPETLIESELFGHRKGAFTGAIDHHQGVFERCNAHGALFLDEIGDVAAPVQIKLLQVLQERTFTPVGGRDKKRFSGRVIAATNRPLAELRQGGHFREDFYYRLCSDVIHVPTLRERIRQSRDELAQLVRLLVARTTGDAGLYDYVLEVLARDVPADYAWPGNVRELEQAVRRVLLTGRYVPELIASATPDGEERLIEQLRAGNLTADELLAGYSAMLYQRLGSYAAVAERTRLDPRTSRKYVLSAKSG